MANINKRKPLVFRNKTNYFSPDVSRSQVIVSSPDTYRFASQKQQAYYNRLYWEFRYCQDHRGQTFFYTLTYNNKSLPRFEGKCCFNYKDLVYLLNGAFKQYLLRNYGTKFKYFVGAELGEGSGSRGMYQNPHYHVLFFLRSADKAEYPYKIISPEEFRSVIRRYWQGFDQDIDGWHSYKLAKFGIVKEGDFTGLVKDYRACLYVSKYVTKDVGLKRFEYTLKKKYSSFYKSDPSFLQNVYDRFFLEFINPRYNIPTRPHLDTNHSDWKFTFTELLYRLSPEVYKSFCEYRRNNFRPTVTPLHFTKDLVDAINLRVEFNKFLEDSIIDAVNKRISEFRNVYSNKCRISHGVGDYALSFVDKSDPRIGVYTEKGFSERPLGLYYYRKLYTQVVKDPFGNPIRVLNQEGIKYKVAKYPRQKEKLVSSISADLEALTPSLYEKALSSVVNQDIVMPFDVFREGVIDNPNKQLIINRYAEYKLVYEGRYFKVPDNGLNPDSNWLVVDPVVDLSRFLQPSYFFQPYNFNGLNDFIDSGCEGYLPFSALPYFCEYTGYFAVFDLLSVYLFVSSDKFREDKAKEISSVRRFHKQLSLVPFYKKF